MHLGARRQTTETTPSDLGSHGLRHNHGTFSTGLRSSLWGVGATRPCERGAYPRCLQPRPS
jgi:hypothetical protein